MVQLVGCDSSFATNSQTLLLWPKDRPDIDGIESITLTEVHLLWGGAYLVLPMEAAELRRAVEWIVVQHDDPFILLAPTGRRVRPDCEQLLKQRKSCFLTLADSIDIDGDGKWCATEAARRRLLTFQPPNIPLASMAGSGIALVPASDREGLSKQAVTNAKLISTRSWTQPDLNAAIIEYKSKRASTYQDLVAGVQAGRPGAKKSAQKMFGRNAISRELGVKAKAMVSKSPEWLALPLSEETLKLRRATLGPDHPDTLTSMANLAYAYQDSGKWALALPLCEETLTLRKAKLGPEHPDTLVSMNNLANVYWSAGKLDLALPLLEETHKLMKVQLGPDHPTTLTSMNNLAIAYANAEKLDLALPLFEETLQFSKAKLGPEHPDTLGSMYNPGSAYCQANRGENAAATIKEFVAGRRKHSKPDDPQFASLLANIAIELMTCKQHDAAEEIVREALTIREKVEPDAWTTFNTKSLLGGALVGQRKYAQSEPLLLAGFEGMKQRETTIPEQSKVRLSEALERLVQLYTGWDAAEPDKGYDAKATEWREKLDEHKTARETATPSDAAKPEAGK